MILTRKVKLYPVGDEEEVDRVYKYIHDGMYNQNKAYNILVSNVYTAYMSGHTDQLTEIYKRGARVPKENNPDWSLYKYGEIIPPKGMQTLSSVKQKAKRAISKQIKDGLLSGKVSVQNRKLDAPLWIESQQFNFFHKYESDDMFLKHVYKKECKIYMKFVNGIVFSVELGQNLNKSHEIRTVFENIFKGIYTVKGSSIQIDDTKIILNLCIDVPKQEKQLDEKMIVGVDLGMAIPATCATNQSEYLKKYIGSIDDFVRVRTQIQNQLRQTKKSASSNSGGHGRKKKMKAVERFKKKEANFVNTYSHYISKNVVDFALKNNAKYINIEALKKDGLDEKVLRNWSYYKLQEQIKYKADKYGIVVRKIDPSYTSQRCSCCGYTDKENRKTQKEFKCLKCGYSVNADYNAARNIAFSENFIE